MEIYGLSKNCTVHFIGIGGISMSSLAQIMIDNGYKVTGSDISQTLITSKLEKLGAKISYEHNEDNVKGADLVVYTAAIKKENPEYVYAIKNNIRLAERSEFLGEIMKSYNDVLCISGTHGKTTTTSMVALILLETELDPTILVGGELKNINGNIKIGENDTFVTEACEYVESFLDFFPTKAIITNIDNDHMDYFKNLDNIIKAFEKFSDLIPKDGILIANGDDKNSSSVINKAKCNVITFGFSDKNNYYPHNLICGEHDTYTYDLCKNGKVIGNITLSVSGKHNVLNSLAAAALCLEKGCDFDAVQSGLSKFEGTKRRFEIKGEYKGAVVVDDYAHHPTEIKTTLNMCKNYGKSRVVTVFQPHTYSRTKLLFNEFAEAFDLSDEIIIADIYAAREKDDGTVSSKMLADEIKKHKDNVKYFSSFDEIESYLKNDLKNDDLFVTIGAGNVYKIGEDLLKEEN